MPSGNAIWQSAQDMLDLMAELDPLCQAIEAELTRDGQEILIRACTGEDAPQSGPSFPVLVRYFDQLEMRREKPRRRGSLTIGLQMTGSDVGTDWPHGRSAKIVAAYSPRPADWWQLDADTPNSVGEIEGTTPSGPRWEVEDDPAQWFFAVPVDALTGPEAIRRLLVDPLLAMIGGTDGATACAGLEAGICHPPPPAQF